eukprot:1106-Heterococcus_DN1.PRE.2
MLAALLDAPTESDLCRVALCRTFKKVLSRKLGLMLLGAILMSGTNSEETDVPAAVPLAGWPHTG